MTDDYDDLYDDWLGTYTEGVRQAYVAAEIDRETFQRALDCIDDAGSAAAARRECRTRLQELGVPSERLTIR